MGNIPASGTSQASNSQRLNSGSRGKFGGDVSRMNSVQENQPLLLKEVKEEAQGKYQINVHVGINM